jgi:hypothetical protein
MSNGKTNVGTHNNSSTKENKSNGNGNNNTGNGNNNSHKLSPEAKARYERNKEFREKKQKYISLDSLYNVPRTFKFYPDKVEEKETEYKGDVISRIQYTVTEPSSKYPNIEKYLSLSNARATELIDTKIYEEGQTLLTIWKKGQGLQTQYFVESAAA